MMSKALPIELKNLITRKLHFQKREQEKQWVSTAQAAYARLHEGIFANVQAQKLSRGLTSTALGIYSEITTSATIMTNEWPSIVWKIISSILEKTGIALRDGQELNAIVDEFAWATGQIPFTLHYIDPDRFSAIVYRGISKYGDVQEDITTHFNKQLKLASSTAQCGINNTAREAREEISIAIDEYLLTKNQETQPGGNDTSNTAKNNPDCLPSPPKNVDDWFLAISDATSIFHKEHGRCPNEAEAWIQLRTAPPTAYGIESGAHHGEPAVFMDGRPLGKRTFSGRWRRYTTIKVT